MRQILQCRLFLSKPFFQSYLNFSFLPLFIFKHKLKPNPSNNAIVSSFFLFFKKRKKKTTKQFTPILFRAEVCFFRNYVWALKFMLKKRWNEYKIQNNFWTKLYCFKPTPQKTPKGNPNSLLKKECRLIFRVRQIKKTQSSPGYRTPALLY